MRVAEASREPTPNTFVTTGSFIGADGTTIFRRAWVPDGPRRAVLVLAHGMSEHSGRYERLGKFLAEREVAVHALDHRGHGRSDGEVGTVESFGHYLDDLSTFLAKVRDEEPSGPLILLGHSMGGLISAVYVLERMPLPDLLILSGPAIVPIIDAGGRRVDATRLTKDLDEQVKYMEDPLILRERVRDELSHRLAEGIVLLVGRAHELKMPVLLIHGTDDPLCSAEGAETWVRSSSSPDVTIKLYEGGRHEMLNETNRDEVKRDIWTWLDARIPARDSLRCA